MANVASANLFDLLEQDVTEVDTVKTIEAPKAAKPATEPVKKETPKPAAEARGERADRGRGSDRGRGGRGRGEGRGGFTRRDDARRDGEREGEPRDDRVSRPRGDRPPRFGGEGDRGERPPRRDDFSTKGEREFDRRSRGRPGSERREPKREGGGSHNWGKPEDENVDAEAAPTTSDAVVPDVVEPKEPTEEELAAQKEREEEEKQMTLDEYRKKQAEGKRQSEVQRRAAGEGVDDSQWKGTVLLSKGEEEIDPIFQEKKKAGQKKKSSKGEPAVHTAELFKFKFNDEARDDRRRERGDRGDRGDRPRGGRGGSGRGGPRRTPAPRNGPAPAIDDSSAFPALG